MPEDNTRRVKLPKHSWILFFLLKVRKEITDKQRTEDRGQRTEDREQKRKQRTESRRHLKRRQRGRGQQH
jgi:hypothetical protein